MKRCLKLFCVALLPLMGAGLTSYGIPLEDIVYRYSTPDPLFVVELNYSGSTGSTLDLGTTALGTLALLSGKVLSADDLSPELEYVSSDDVMSLLNHIDGLYAASPDSERMIYSTTCSPSGGSHSITFSFEGSTYNCNVNICIDGNCDLSTMYPQYSGQRGLVSLYINEMTPPSP